MKQRFLLILLINVLPVSCLFGQKKSEFPVGKIIDTVLCASDNHYSYALFLPDQYDPKKLWPVIYIYDPGGNGKAGLKNFIPGSLKYGYILACSNNSKNGIPWEVIIKASENMMKDAGRKFPLDKNRIYTSGFSGGSRVASLIALNDTSISGVIGCGAGFPSETDFTEPLTFDYFGLIGYRDFNYYEMTELEQKLKNTGVNVRIHKYDTSHVRAPENEIVYAMEWIQLQAIKKGYIQNDTMFVRNQYIEKLKEADELVRNDELTEAVRIYQYILIDFLSIADKKDIEHKVGLIENSSEYKKEISEKRKLKIKEGDKKNSYINSLRNIASEASFADSVKIWWNNEMRSLKNMEKSSKKENQYMAARLLGILNILCYDTGNNYMELKKYQNATAVYQLWTIIRPDNCWTYFHLARSLSCENKKNGALNALKEAVKNGFDNYSILSDDPAFINLKSDKRFNSILSGIIN